LLVERITQQGWPPQVAPGASRWTVEEPSLSLVARYRCGGTAALADRSSAPQRRQYRTSPERIAEIERLRRQRLPFGSPDRHAARTRPFRITMHLDTRNMALGPALFATKSFSHPDIGRAHGRAWELCQQLADHSREFTALRGLMLHHANLLEMEKAQHFAEEALRLAKRLDVP
jgi:hypothetical protein